MLYNGISIFFQKINFSKIFRENDFRKKLIILLCIHTLRHQGERKSRRTRARGGRVLPFFKYCHL